MFSYLCVTEFLKFNVYGNVIKKKKKERKDDDVSFVMFLFFQTWKKSVVITSVCRMPNKRCNMYHKCLSVLMKDKN